MSSPEMSKGHFGVESYVHFSDIEWMEVGVGRVARPEEICSTISQRSQRTAYDVLADVEADLSHMNPELA
eukprot:5641328-Prorocentrum_lima.AAC.1